MEKKGLLVVMSGPSGAGKGTIVNRILALKKDIAVSVSCTTRAPRAGEVEGVSYFYLKGEKFQEKIDNGGLLEYAEFVGNKYGTPKDKVLESLEDGTDIILEIEVQGAEQIREKHDGAVLIFIVPPSLNELKKRLVKRGTETAEQANNRLAKAEKELGLMQSYNYVVINDDVDVAARKVIDIINVEKLNVVRNKDLKERLIKGETIK